MLKLKISLISLSKHYELITPANIFLMYLALTCVNMASFINLFVSTLPKMELLNERIGISIARTLSFQMNVLKQYWADVVSTVCYLINRMPSFVLNDEIPYFFSPPDICFLLFWRYMVVFVLLRIFVLIVLS